MKKNQLEQLEQILQKSALRNYGAQKKIRGNGAVIYTRVSSQEQAQNNGSLEVQLKYCREYCSRNDLIIKDYFGGTYESAKTDGRKEFKRMLDYSRKDKSISHIVVHNYDRFSRTGSAAARLSEELQEQGITLKSVSQDLDTSNAVGRLSENMFHMLSNFDNRMKSDRTKINTREVMLKGFWPYATPLGYDNLKKKHRACFHEYVITEIGKELKKAFVWKAEGKLTNMEIIKRLNIKGVKINKTNFQWVISNPFYAGYVTGRLVEGKLIKGQHPALVDLKTFLKANNMLSKATGTGIPKKFRHEELPLKSFVRDEISDHPLTGYRTKGIWYYKVKEAAEPVNISANKLNDLFIKNLNRFEYQKKYTPDFKKLVTQRIKEQLSSMMEEVTQLKRKITEKENQIEEMEEKFVVGEIPKKLYEKYLKKFTGELETLKENLRANDIEGSNLERAVEKCLEIAQNLSQSWISASYEVKQQLQRLVFPEGVLYNKKIHSVRTPRVNSLFAEIEPLAKVLAENKNGDSEMNRQKLSQVPRTGFEPARPFGHHHLKVACLPISTPGLGGANIGDMLGSVHQSLLNFIRLIFLIQYGR